MPFTSALMWFVLSLMGVVASHAYGGFIGGLIVNAQTLVVITIFALFCF
jgi:hypothetical protein